MVALIPPAATKPRPRAPAAAAGRCERSLPPMLVASPSSVRSSSTASANCSRSALTSCLSCRSSVAAILQRLRRELRFLDRLHGDQWCSLAEPADPDRSEHAGKQDERTRDD